MSVINEDFGVQSYCFRTIDANADVAEAVKKIGLKKIEVCRKHCDFANPAVFDETIATYRDAGVEIISIGVEGLTGDEAEDRKRFDFAKAAGLKHISVNFNPDSFDKAHKLAQKLADDYDVTLGIHNHGGYHWLGNVQMLDHVFKQVGPRIGLTLDTAWCLDAKGKPLEWMEKFADRLFAMHLKDFTFHPDRMHEDVVVGEGNIDLAALIKKAEEVNFTGLSILEYEGDPDNPVPTLLKCVEKIKAGG